MYLNDSVKTALINYGSEYVLNFSEKTYTMSNNILDIHVKIVFSPNDGEYNFHYVQYYTPEYEHGFEFFDDTCFNKKIRTWLKNTFADMFMLIVKNQ
jgi:hypothetical protein